MSKIEKNKPDYKRLDYAQEDWYKSNRTPENLKQYELGDDLVPEEKGSIASNNQRSKLEDPKTSGNQLEMKKRRFSEDMDNFEFGEDNYFGVNGTLNQASGRVQMNQTEYESMASLQNMAEHNHYDESMDAEFGSDYFELNEKPASKKNKKD